MWLRTGYLTSPVQEWMHLPGQDGGELVSPSQDWDNGHIPLPSLEWMSGPGSRCLWHTHLAGKGHSVG